MQESFMAWNFLTVESSQLRKVADFEAFRISDFKIKNLQFLQQIM